MDSYRLAVLIRSSLSCSSLRSRSSCCCLSLFSTSGGGRLTGIPFFREISMLPSFPIFRTSSLTFPDDGRFGTFFYGIIYKTFLSISAEDNYFCVSINFKKFFEASSSRPCQAYSSRAESNQWHAVFPYKYPTPIARNLLKLFYILTSLTLPP